MLWAVGTWAVGATGLEGSSSPGAQDSDSPLIPDSVLALPGGAVLVLERARGLPAAGIRVSAPLDRPAPGAVRVLLDQALARALPQAEAVGATLEAGVSDGRIYYQVVGDLRDIDELAWIARRMTRPPAPDADDASAWEHARAERSAETPQGRLARAVRRQAGLDPGGDLGLADAAAGAARRLWLRSHARDRLRVFVLGDVPLPWVLADLSRIGAPSRGPGTDDAGRADEPPGASAPLVASGSRGADARDAPVYAWEAAAFQLGSAGDPAALAVLGALRTGLRAVAVPGAELRLHREPGGASGWAAVTARARRGRAAAAALDAALALLTEEGMDAWWLQGAAEARMELLRTASTPGGWLALADRYFVGPPQAGRGARAGGAAATAPAWPSGALARLQSLHRSDLAPALERFRATVFRPRVGS